MAFLLQTIGVDHHPVVMMEYSITTPTQILITIIIMFQS
jgi:hypothetical protein